MFLYIGTLCLSLCYFLFVISILGTRSSKKPRWTGETIMGFFISPLIVALLAFGVAGIVQSLFSEFRPSIIDMAIALAIIAATAALHVVFGVGKKLAASAKVATHTTGVIQGNFNGSPSGNSNSPSNNTPSDLPKAA